MQIVNLQMWKKAEMWNKKTQLPFLIFKLASIHYSAVIVFMLIMHVLLLVAHIYEKICLNSFSIFSHS